MTRAYTVDELRDVVDAFAHAVTVTHDDEIVIVNAAMCALVGHAREEMEGKPFHELLPADERARLREQAHQFQQTGHPPRERFFTIAGHRDGHRIPVHIEISVLPAKPSGLFVMASCFEAPEDRHTLELSDALVQASTAFVGEITEQRVRRAVVLGLERSGLWAGFYSAHRGELSPLETRGEPPEPLRKVYAYEAIYENRPVFAGSGVEISHAFVPLSGDPAAEVLVVFGAFSARHGAALSLFAKQIAGAFDNARLIANLEARNHETQLLLELSRTIAGTLEVTAILDISCDYLVRLVDASNCFVMLYDEDARTLRAAAASGSVRQHFHRSSGLPLDDPKSLAARCARERRPIAVEDVGDSPIPVSRRYVDQYGQRALLALPLMSRDQLLGVAILDDTRGPRRFNPNELELAQATMGQIALSVSNARLYASLKQSYAVLAEARAEMVKQERLAALGELSAIVAHEVRNPLGVIFNAVSSLRKLVNANPDSTLLVDILAEESDRLNRLVGELLDFARPRELLMNAEDVGRLIQDSIEAAASDPQRGSHAVVFEAEIEPGLPPVPMDRRLIRQALVNVAVNATQAMPRGGKLQVHALREQRDGKHVLRIDLKDEGPGIPPEVASRIFEPFFTTKAKGTGLGLAVVKRILEDHQGEIEVSSQLGKGTTFTFRIPMRSFTERGA